MSSNKEQKNKLKQDNTSFFSEEVEEIKEIVERRPEPERKRSSSGAWYGSLWNSIKKIVGKAIVSVAKGVGTLQKNARGPIVLSAFIGLGLLIAVIVLSVRLSGVTKELESVQAMSLGLQEELAVAKQELKDSELQLFSKNEAPTEVVQEQIVTSAPTVAPIATATPVVKKYVVCVDAGHGDWDGGAVFKDDAGRELRAEKDDNLRMAKWFRDALEVYGIDVVLTRENDVYLGLKERTAIANGANADALISFHRNSFEGDDEVRGVEFWIHSSQPQGANTLANSMLDAIMEVGGMPDRGVKSGSKDSFSENLEINRSAKMTSMIVELGFISSATDNEAYDTHGKEYAEKMAKAVYEWLEAQDAGENK